MIDTLHISTPNLQIRHLQPTDLADFHHYRSNPEVTKYQGFDVMTTEQCAAFIQEQADKKFGKAGQWIQYGIENKTTGKIIGDCAIKLDQHDTRIAEIGITISDMEQKKGYAKEVMLAMLVFLFDTQNVLRVVETVDVENIAAINLLKSLGFRQEGHFIENIFFKGAWGSEFQYALLKREWDAKLPVFQAVLFQPVLFQPIAEIILYVANQQKSRDFYAAILQKKPSLDVPGMTEFELANGLKLGLMPENSIAKILLDKTPHPSTGSGIPRCELYLMLENIQEAYQIALQSGAKEVSPIQNRDWGHQVGYVVDFDGHIVAFAKG